MGLGLGQSLQHHHLLDKWQNHNHPVPALGPTKLLPGLTNRLTKTIKGWHYDSIPVECWMLLDVCGAQYPRVGRRGFLGRGYGGGGGGGGNVFNAGKGGGRGLYGGVPCFLFSALWDLGDHEECPGYQKEVTEHTLLDFGCAGG